MRYEQEHHTLFSSADEGATVADQSNSHPCSRSSLSRGIEAGKRGRSTPMMQ